MTEGVWLGAALNGPWTRQRRPGIPETRAEIVVVLRNGGSGARPVRASDPVSSGVAVGDVRPAAGRQPRVRPRPGSAGPDERDAPRMTTIAMGLTVPRSPATLGITDVPGVERRQQRGAVSDADPRGIEVLGAPVLRSPLDRDTAQPEAVS